MWDLESYPVITGDEPVFDASDVPALEVQMDLGLVDAASPRHEALIATEN